jgi:hypothetical protein
VGGCVLRWVFALGGPLATTEIRHRSFTCRLWKILRTTQGKYPAQNTTPHLDGLEFRVELDFSSWVPVRVVLECFPIS